MKSFRLAIFNIRKRKLEVAWLVLLITMCMTLLGSAVMSISGMDGIIDNSFARNESIHNFFMMDEASYKSSFDEFLVEQEKVVNYEAANLIHETYIKYFDQNNEEKSAIMAFITLENDAKLEKLVLESSYTLDEIMTKDHFILMPFYAKDTMGYKEGDTYKVLYNEKIYPFEVAGFYDTGIFADTSMGLKFIISDKDYSMLSRVLGEKVVLGYDTVEGQSTSKILNDLYDFYNEHENNTEATVAQGADYRTLVLMGTVNMKLLMGIMIAMSVVVLVAILFIIRYRIKNNIEEQIVSIGVLEAIGYTAKEIAWAYAYEYLIIALPALLLGGLLTFFATPALLRAGEIMCGHHGAESKFSIVPFLLGILLLGFILLISFLKARQVRKYPPVVALRKGTQSHSFRKNVLPLEKSKWNVHVSLALKGFLTNMGTNIGMGACIGVAVIAMVVCFVIHGFYGNGINAVKPILGMEMPDVCVAATIGTDEQALREELLSLPEVRKVNLTNNFLENTVQIKGQTLFTFAYEDFDQTENINCSQGRAPKHDNEVMVSEVGAIILQLKIGDTVTIHRGRMEAEYMVCGLAKSNGNGGGNTYMTAEGLKRLNPALRLASMEIYLENGVDSQAFKKQLFETYSSPMADPAKGDEEITGTLEERIQKTAEEKITAMLEMYGVSSVDYAIMIGDKMITGDSSKFRIQSSLNLTELVQSQMANQLKAFTLGTEIFMVVAEIVVTIIIMLLMQAAVRKQRKDLGILKGMGYTTRELMLQMAGKIVPMLVIATLLGSVLGALLGKLMFLSTGNIPVSILGVLGLDLIIIVFGTLVAFISAGKIKKISVYELMQE